MSNDTPNFRAHYPYTTIKGKKNRKFQKWRRPRGIDRTLSEKRGPRPKIGYGHDNKTKGFHPCGLKESLVCSQTDLQKVIDSKENVAVRFSGKLGLKKKTMLKEMAIKNKLKVLN